MINHGRENVCTKCIHIDNNYGDAMTVLTIRIIIMTIVSMVLCIYLYKVCEYKMIFFIHRGIYMVPYELWLIILLAQWLSQT